MAPEGDGFSYPLHRFPLRGHTVVSGAAIHDTLNDTALFVTVWTLGFKWIFQKWSNWIPLGVGCQ
jgi:hypothetical protein